MRPRVLILSTAYLPHIGGSELAIHHIAERLHDFDVDVVTGRLDGAHATMEQIGRVRVFRAGGRWSRFSMVFPKLLLPFAMAVTALRLLRKRDYMLIHAYQASQAAGAAWLVKILHPSMPLLVTLQEGKNLERQSWLVRIARRLILRRADAVTAISGHLVSYAQQYTRRPVYLIPNGVDIASMQVPDISRDPYEVMTVSRLVEKNNVANLIRAMVRMRAQVPRARLTIVGSGRLRNELTTLVAGLQLTDAVDFIGAVHHDKLPELLARAGVFARPSLSEGLGSAFLEAMGARVPVVASPVGGISDIVHHEQTGLLCNPHDPGDIALAIVRLMTDGALRERIVIAAETMVRTQYEWTMIARRMEDVYRKIIR